MSDLRRMNISENKIPSYKQLQNKMFYFRRNKLMYINEVNPLEDKLRPLVFTGDESDEQPFVYHYKCDANNELILGDGTDEWVVTLLIISLFWLRNMFHNLL